MSNRIQIAYMVASNFGQIRNQAGYVMATLEWPAADSRQEQALWEKAAVYNQVSLGLFMLLLGGTEFVVLWAYTVTTGSTGEPQP